MFGPEDDADLRFYFSEAKGAVGLKSPLGIQLEKLAALYVPGTRGSRRCRAPKRQHGVTLSDDCISDAGLEATFRAGNIRRIIASLDTESQTILSLHYSEPAAVNLNTKNRDEHLIFRNAGVSLGLAAGTEAALCGYTAFQSRGRCMPGATLEMSIQAWVVWLVVRAKKEPKVREALQSIIDQARHALTHARGAYVRAKEVAA